MSKERGRYCERRLIGKLSLEKDDEQKWNMWLNEVLTCSTIKELQDNKELLENNKELKVDKKLLKNQFKGIGYYEAYVDLKVDVYSGEIISVDDFQICKINALDVYYEEDKKQHWKEGIEHVFDYMLGSIK